MNNVFKVGICGVGYVGSAISTGLESFLQSQVDIREYDKYKSSESLYDVVNNSDIIFVCVPTPIDEDGWCDTSIVEDISSKINELATEKKIIVIKSTVTPGTTEEIASCYSKHAWFFSPEFLTEEKFIEDFLNQDRIILGKTSSCTERDINVLMKLFEQFTMSQSSPANIYTPNSVEAEMVKYAGNCFLTTKVVFFNEIYKLCESMKIDYEVVKTLTGLDKRIGSSHMNVPGKHGFGIGGSCFPKDTQALIALFNSQDVDSTLLESVWTKNLILRNFEEDWLNLSQVNGKYVEDNNE